MRAPFEDVCNEQFVESMYVFYIHFIAVSYARVTTFNFFRYFTRKKSSTVMSTRQPSCTSVFLFSLDFARIRNDGIHRPQTMPCVNTVLNRKIFLTVLLLLPFSSHRTQRVTAIVELTFEPKCYNILDIVATVSTRKACRGVKKNCFCKTNKY